MRLHHPRPRSLTFSLATWDTIKTGIPEAFQRDAEPGGHAQRGGHRLHRGRRTLTFTSRGTTRSSQRIHESDEGPRRVSRATPPAHRRQRSPAPSSKPIRCRGLAGAAHARGRHSDARFTREAVVHSDVRPDPLKPGTTLGDSSCTLARMVGTKWAATRGPVVVMVESPARRRSCCLRLPP